MRKNRCLSIGGEEAIPAPSGWSGLGLVRAGALALVVLVIAGCGSRGPRITVNWRKPKPELAENTSLRYQSIEVGVVRYVQAAPGGGTTVTIRLKPKYAHYVREKSTFLVEAPKGGQAAYIDLVPLDRGAPQALPDAVFEGAESRLEAKVRISAKMDSHFGVMWTAAGA
jgi:hypothetical protein